LPVLEAMASGTAAVISDAAALREVAQDAALSAPAEDPAALADALARLLDDGELRRERVALGLRRAAAFGWPSAAERTERVLREAVESGSGRSRR
jgi:glycosyltransferase involved in cell wall biosynthesis